MSIRLKHICRIRTACVVLSLVLFAILFPRTGISGSFSVNPVRIELSESAHNAVIHVENTSATQVTIQMTTMAWSQENDKDHLRPTRELLSTPQIFILKPGATQLVRVGALRKPDNEKELAYRLLLEEIPPLLPPDFKGLQVALRISMPIFLKPTKSATEKLEFAFSREPKKGLKLLLSNSGNGVAQISGIRLYDGTTPETLFAAYPNTVYVLPGYRREISLQTGDSGSAKKILIRAVMRGVPVEFYAVSLSP